MKVKKFGQFPIRFKWEHVRIATACLIRCHSLLCKSMGDTEEDCVMLEDAEDYIACAIAALEGDPMPESPTMQDIIDEPPEWLPPKTAEWQETQRALASRSSDAGDTPFIEDLLDQDMRENWAYHAQSRYMVT